MDNKSVIWKNSVNYGIILGFIFIIYSVILYILNIMPISFIAIGILLINIVILIVGVVIGIKQIRDKTLDGSINFGYALLSGLIIIIIASIFNSIYSYIFNVYIDPEYLNKVLEANKEWVSNFMTKRGVPEVEIERQLNLMESKPIPTPIKSSVQSLIMFSAIGAVVSLIVAAILKKDKQQFTE